MIMTEAAISKWRVLIKELDLSQTKDIGERDLIEEFKDMKVVVDFKSMMFLSDATVDYKDGLMDSGFVVEIPSAKTNCGCGESFSV